MWTHVLDLLGDELGHPLLESLRLGGVRSREKREGTLKKTKPWSEERDGRRRGKGRAGQRKREDRAAGKRVVDEKR